MVYVVGTCVERQERREEKSHGSTSIETNIMAPKWLVSKYVEGTWIKASNNELKASS